MTPGTRNRVAVDYSGLSKKGPEKSLLAKKTRGGGRNGSGKMTNRHRGGGHKKRYRIVDFKRDNHGVTGEVKSVEYDPNRTAFICLVNYTNGDKRYVIAPDGIKVGDKLESGKWTRRRSSEKCWSLCAIDQQGRQVCNLEDAIWRNKNDFIDVYGNYWYSFKRRSQFAELG